LKTEQFVSFSCGNQEFAAAEQFVVNLADLIEHLPEPGRKQPGFSGLVDLSGGF